MPLKIVQASNTSTTKNEDLSKLIALGIEASRSNPLTRCMLRRPDSYASHKQYAQNSYHNALDNDDTRIFMALSTAQNDLGTILGSVLLEYCRIADPMFVFELPDFERLGVKEDLFVYGQIEAHKKRREVMESDYYIIAAPDVSPTHPRRIETCTLLVSHAVDEIRETDIQSDIVAQVTLDSEDIEKVYPDAEGWDHSRLPLVLASKMLPSLNETQRSLKTLVNWGSGPPR